MRWTLLAFVAYLLLLTAALCVSNPFAAAGAFQGDLRRFFESYVAPAAHFLTFLPLGWLAMALHSPISRLLRIGLLISYSFATEAAQGVVPMRTPEWRDIAQNLAGVSAGAFAWWSLRNTTRDGGT